MKTQKGQQTRERIREAARALITERGFQAATMRAIAKEAGLSPGAAYHYFPSKDSLVLDLYAETQRALTERLTETGAPSGTLAERLQVFFAQRFEILAKHRELLTRLAVAVIAPDSPVSPFGDATAAIRADAIGDFRVVIGDSADDFSPEIQAVLPEMCWLGLMALILFWLYDRSPGQTRTHALYEQAIPMACVALEMMESPFGQAFRDPVLGMFESVRAVFGTAPDQGESSSL